MKDTLTTIRSRTSVRKYTGQAIDGEQITALLAAAMAAPSSKNLQPWHFIVLTQRTALHALAARLPYAKMLADAAAAIVVCGDTAVHTGAAAGSWVMDCSAATQNILLAAHAMDIGAVWTGAYPYPDRLQAVQTAVNLPDGIVPLSVVALGYPADKPRPLSKWKPERIHYEQW